MDLQSLKRTSTALYKGDKAQSHMLIKLDPVVETAETGKNELALNRRVRYNDTHFPDV